MHRRMRMLILLLLVGISTALAKGAAAQSRLALTLSGPFVICEEQSELRILVPQSVIGTHHAPQIFANGFPQNLMIKKGGSFKGFNGSPNYKGVAYLDQSRKRACPTDTDKTVGYAFHVPLPDHLNASEMVNTAFDMAGTCNNNAEPTSPAPWAMSVILQYNSVNPAKVQFCVGGTCSSLIQTSLLLSMAPKINEDAHKSFQGMNKLAGEGQRCLHMLGDSSPYYRGLGGRACRASLIAVCTPSGGNICP